VPTLEVYGVTIVPNCFWQIIYIGPSMFGQKTIVWYVFQAGDDFISINKSQLLYHNDMVNARNGHYELITFYNASWEVDQNMLPQTKHTNQSRTMSFKK
jgi:hypothetical protein